MEMPEPFRECVSGIDAACHIPIADLLGRPEGISRCTCRRSGARSVPTGGTVQGSPESRWVQGNPAEVSPSPTGDGSNGSAGGDRSEGKIRNDALFGLLLRAPRSGSTSFSVSGGDFPQDCPTTGSCRTGTHRVVPVLSAIHSRSGGTARFSISPGEFPFLSWWSPPA